MLLLLIGKPPFRTDGVESGERCLDIIQGLPSTDAAQLSARQLLRVAAGMHRRLGARRRRRGRVAHRVEARRFLRESGGERRSPGVPACQEGRQAEEMLKRRGDA